MIRWILLICIYWCQPLQAQTELPDTLTALYFDSLATDPMRITLQLEDSPFDVVTRTVILSGMVVTVEPGVEFIFRQELPQVNTGLVVNGVLRAIGTETQPITMRVSDEAEDLNLRWNGVTFMTAYQDSAEADSVVGIVDRIPSILEHCRIEGSNIGVTCSRIDNGFDAPIPFNVEIKNCYLNDHIISVYINRPSRVLVRNNISRNSIVADIQVVYAETRIFNNLFMRTPERVNDSVIRLFDVQSLLQAEISYNCYSLDFEAVADSLILLHSSNNDEIFIELDPHSFIADPVFADTLSFSPDPVWSPLIDTGHPEYQDPDGSRSDIGMVHVAVEPFAAEFVEPPEELQWVTGFDYAYAFSLIGYPIPEVELLQAPDSMRVRHWGRTRISLEWLGEHQVDGNHLIHMRATNVVNEEIVQDSVFATLIFNDNTAPTGILVSPCDQDSCTGENTETILVDGLIARDTLDIQLAFEDFEIDFLGLDDELFYTVFRNEEVVFDQTLRARDTLFYSEILDTARVDLSVHVSDGLLSREVDFLVLPRYQLISGTTTGLFDPAAGPAYVTGPISVPAGATLTIPPSSRLVIGSSWQEAAAIFQVEGQLDIAGTTSAPVEFISQVPWGQALDQRQDPRPNLFRLGELANVLALRDCNFTGFDEAIRLEYLLGSTRIQDCDFINCRMGVLAIGSTVDIRNCYFTDPADSAQLGSSMIYLAGGANHHIRNNLFVNPSNAITLIDALAEVSNNSFHSRYTLSGNFEVYLPSWMIGGARVLSLGSELDLRNNLFHFKTELSGTVISLLRLQEDAQQKALWLDPESNISSSYNWFDIPDARRSRDTTATGDPISYDRLLAYNDSTLLQSNEFNGSGESGYDQDSGFLLLADSPLINAGDPASAWQDGDGTRNDIGYQGGPLGDNLGGAGSRTPGGELLTLPSSIRLLPAYPNPFNPETTIRFELGIAAVVDLSVYDLRGRRVHNLVHSRLEPGHYSFVLDGSAMASGPYFVHATTKGGQDTIKLLLLK